MKNIVKITLLMIVLLLSISFVSANENITSEQTDLLEKSLSQTNLTNTIEEEPLSTENEDVLTVTIINDTIYTVTDDNTYSSTNESIYAATSDSLLTYTEAVDQSSTADRTFKMGKFKITLSKSQYSVLLYAKQKDFDEYGEYYYMDSYDKYGPYTVIKYYNPSSSVLLNRENKQIMRALKSRCTVKIDQWIFAVTALILSSASTKA